MNTQIDDDAEERDRRPGAGETIPGHITTAAQPMSEAEARKQPSTWSSTRPALCMKA